MLNKIRKHHSDQFKFKVALEAIKGEKPVAELCQEYSVASAQIYLWKKQLEDSGHELFSRAKKSKNPDAEKDHLLRVIGKVTAERDFLSRALGL